MNKIYEAVKEKCEKEGVELLYLSKFGSHLYGTDTEDSDDDYKGIFLPSMEQCVLGEMPKNMNWSTGDGDSRNTSEDVDVSLWSLQYFMKLVAQGETNALDLLYSFTYEDMIIYSHTSLFLLFQNRHQELFNIKDCKSFVGYAIGQAKKYGMKGSRLGVIKKISELTDELIVDIDINDLDNIKLSHFMDYILEKCHEPSFCFKKEIGGIPSLVICGKVHQDNIDFMEFKDRIDNEYKKYGDRAKKAEQNEGIDWKAISHAKRAIVQMDMLIEEGKIEYPLRDSKRLLDIKQGKVDFKTISKEISEDIERISDKMKSEDFIGFHKKNKNLIKDFIIEFYR